MAEAGDFIVIDRTFVRVPRPGDTIRGQVRIPDGPLPRTAVVVVHGFKGFKDWGFFPYACERLAAAGHAVVSFNFSRNGVGEDLESFSELDRFGANTLSLELDELRLILDEVFDGDILPFRPARVGLLGHSRGGGQVILGAAEEPRVSAVVSWAAVSTFNRWTEETKAKWREDGRYYVKNARTGQHLPLDLTMLEDFEANAERLDIPAAAARVETPWLIVHGTHDLTVRVRDGKALAGFQPDAKLRLIDGAGHTFNAKHPFEGPPPELDRALDETIAHFESHLLG